jgi:hypothetical protein
MVEYLILRSPVPVTLAFDSWRGAEKVEMELLKNTRQLPSDLNTAHSPPSASPSLASSHLGQRVQVAFLSSKVAAVRGSSSSQLVTSSLSRTEMITRPLNTSHPVHPVILLSDAAFKKFFESMQVEIGGKIPGEVNRQGQGCGWRCGQKGVQKGWG